MKKIILLASLLIICSTAQNQILKKMAEKAKQKAEEKANEKMDKKTDPPADENKDAGDKNNLATPSLFTYYKRPPILKNALVIGISQSVKSPDIVSVLDEGQRQGCLTLSITNEPNSPLARSSDFVLDIQAGVEKAVAATKTYTSELLAVAMLSAALNGNKKQWVELDKVSALDERDAKENDFISQTVQRYRYIDQTVVLGRGFNYATAFEWALKLKELTYIIAEPYSSADFAHGPIAMVKSGYPIFAVAAKGKVFNPMLQMLQRLRSDISAELVIISKDKEALSLAQVPWLCIKEVAINWYK